MKIKFDSNLEFQKEAIASITGIFEGQEVCKDNFSVLAPTEITIENVNIEDKGGFIPGYSNKLDILEEELLDNVRKIQLRNGLKQSSSINKKDLNFTVEMETGTGKTYVYLRTIFEMNKLYGFTKFIIVVPSIAIKEGTNKSLDITKEHFKALYDNTRYDYFTYESKKLEQVRSFATNDYIQIMVTTVQAFNKDANIINRYNDKLGGLPLHLIQQTNPIVIIDEPQSVDSADKSKEAIKSLNPLCCLRYSATHKEKYNLMYKLDSVDAYEKKLVKQIEVSSLEVTNFQNNAYIKLVSVSNNNNSITARLEVDVMEKGKTKRKTITVKQNTDLVDKTKRNIYSGYIVKDIACLPDNEFIDFTSKPETIRLGMSIGSIDDNVIKRSQIATTIRKHLDKELILNPKGIKVLSLFFIDKVANYRFYDDQGNPQQGKYAIMFEEEYSKIASGEKYKNLFKHIKDIGEEAEVVHNGYFSADKKGKLKDTKGTTLADDDTYSLIMKDKERLLSFDSKLRFIFSHSALKEGWDNPNVFQICTLNETKAEMKKRQEIGRGLRLCVNQDGERIHGFDVNTLTVMANESYNDFVTKLQKEIEKDTGIRFGILDSHNFANIITGMENNKPMYLGEQKSEELYNFCIMKGYVDKRNNKVNDLLRTHLRENTVVIPDEFEAVKGQVLKQLRRVAGNLNIKDASEKKKIETNKEVLISEEFKNLWDKVKYKTTFSVDFDSEKLVEKCAEDIKYNLFVKEAKLTETSRKIKQTRGGILSADTQDYSTTVKVGKIKLPDIVGYLQNETNLTRKSIVDILLKSEKLQHFKTNPQKFIDGTIDIIKTQMRHFIVDGIKYQKIGDDYFYAQELFENQELYGHLKQDMVESSKSPYEYVKYDSNIESEMAQSFEKSNNVKVYAKLPAWFKIDTPLGSYNPDWAILWEHNGQEKLYFVVETKGTLSWEFLRPTEKGKIECGKKHFQALGNDVSLKVADSFESLRERIK